MNKPTGSSLERAEKCPGSFHLPLIPRTSEDAERGTHIHAFLQKLGDGAPMSEALKAAGDYAALCSLIDVDKLPIGSGFIAEAKMVYNVETGEARRVRTPGLRDYGEVSELELCMTTDVLGCDDERAVVADYKSGDYVTPIADNLQMMAQAVAAASILKKPRAYAMLAYIRPDGREYFDAIEWDEFDLLAIKKRIARIWVDVKLGAGKLSEGKWCRYCPAYTACPAKMQLALALGNRSLMERWEEKALEGAIQDAYRQYKHAKEVLDRIGKDIYGAARQKAIDLGNGRFLGEMETERESLTGIGVFDAISALHGIDVAKAAVSVEATKTGLREALRPIAEASGKKISHLEKEALEAIRERGGAVKKVTKTVREHSKKEDGE